MKKILIPFTVMHTSANVLTFAFRLSKNKSIPVKGVFITEQKEENAFGYLFPNDLSLAQNRFCAEDIVTENKKIIEDDIKLFKDKCENEGIVYEIERDISVKEFIYSTGKDDLVITDKRADFLEMFLTHIHCPAYIVSESEVPLKVVILYDGSDFCKQAFEMYLILFPEWQSLPASLVSINTNEELQQQIELDIKTKWQPQFADFSMQLLQGNKEEELIRFLKLNNNDALVVMGAFGRSAVSRFFHESLANTVIENSRCSLFIAH